MRFLLFLMLVLCIDTAQAEWNDSIRYKVEVSATLSGGANTPFWLMNDIWGLSSRTRNNGYLRGGLFHDMDTTKRFTWGAGADLAVAGRFTSTFIVQQLYGEVKYRCLYAMVGQKQIEPQINGTDLGMGNLLYSRNARPIPQVRVGIQDYSDVWGCNGWFAVKGYLAFGKFTDNRWIKSWVNPDSKYTLGTLYHSKGIFFRVGNTRKFPLQFELGLEMATEFGGELHNKGKVTKMPTGIKNWLKAVIPSRGGSDTPEGDQVNVEGNMLGVWNFALSWNQAADWKVKLYYDHFFEDHSMMFFDYAWKDGLYGVEAQLPTNPVIGSVAFEYLYTKDQSGAVYWDHTPEINEQVSGRDNYYNHYFYNGWQNWGMGIGNPFITSPIYNDNHTMTFRNNRVVAYSIGLKGTPTRQLSYMVKCSYSRNWGTYSQPFSEVMNNCNVMFKVNWHPEKLRGWQGEIAVAADGGSLLGRSAGVMLKISKTGWLFRPKNK